MRLTHILIVLPLLLAGATSAAEMFRWVDADGKVHYTDAPPPPTAKNVQQKNLGDKSGGGAQMPYTLQQAVKNFPVTLYSSACGDPCVSAKALLGKRGIPFTEKNPEKNAADSEALKKLIGGPVVPVLIIGTDVLKGFDESRWNGALDLVGYPKDSLLSKSSGSPAAATPSAAPTPAAPPTPPAQSAPETDKSAPGTAATPQQPSPQPPPQPQ